MLNNEQETILNAEDRKFSSKVLSGTIPARETNVRRWTSSSRSSSQERTPKYDFEGKLIKAASHQLKRSHPKYIFGNNGNRGIQ